MVFGLIGNQNSGKTTLFNQLTGSNQHVGNFPGVTVDKKEGTIRRHPDASVVDLPGIYSLSPYTSEEIVTRDFLINERPDGIINIVDATNLERNLYLTLQVMELGIPMVVALNMMDEVRSSGTFIDIPGMSKMLGIPFVPISASRNEGVDELCAVALETAKNKTFPAHLDFCHGAIHRAIHSIGHMVEDHAQTLRVPKRFAATKLIEGDEPMIRKLSVSKNDLEGIKHIVDELEQTLGTDREAALADMRYSYIEALCAKFGKKLDTDGHSLSFPEDRPFTGASFYSFPTPEAIAAGGWVAVVVIIVICLIALICGSVFGIFFSGEDSGTGQSMRTAVQEINTDYDNQLLEIRNGTSYDTLEMSGSRAVWKEVLAVYSVKVNTDPNEPMKVATMDDTKKQLLKDIFWEMNDITSRTESHSETVITETDDGNGNIVQTETTETRTTLYITVSHKTVEEMADQYGFNEEQREYLAELLEDKNNSLWAAVLYGIRYSDDQIVTVALSQVGNVGGEPYWSWYGFGSRVEWCACFVSWCANECGYIETGVIPKFAGCVNGVQWFKDRGQWMDGSAEPVPGMIIFFDWDNKGRSGPQDGQSDHVGIVQKVENGIVYTVEGNSGDSCCVNQYSVGHYEVLGYGVPQY